MKHTFFKKIILALLLSFTLATPVNSAYLPNIMPQGFLLGRGSASGTGLPENITVGSGLTLTGTTLDATGGGGTVTNVSVVNANGFDGTVANATTTPAITLKTTITGLLKGNGTAISAAVANTDYLSGSLADNKLWLGNGSNVATQVSISGDATTANTGALTIANNAVTYAKMQAVSTTSKLLGSSSTTTPVQEITLGTGLSMSGTTLNASGFLSSTLTDTHIFVGNASNVATDVAMSGDATLANTGAITVNSFTVANEGTDTTTFPLFTVSATGANLAPKSNANLTFDSSIARLGSTSFKGGAFLSSTANPAALGVFRLANTEKIMWRNAANSTQFGLALNASNNFEFDAGTGVVVNGALTATTFNGLTLTDPAGGNYQIQGTTMGAAMTYLEEATGWSIEGNSPAVKAKFLKAFNVNNALTLAGTDSTTMTFPTTSATIARTDAAQTFTGASTITSWKVITSLIPNTNDGATLGVASTGEWSDLFCASGCVLNFANGNVTVTHSTGALTTVGAEINTGTASTSTSVTFTSADCGKPFMWSPGGTATATLPANGTAQGCIIDIYLYTNQTVTVSAATADTLVAFNDTAADSIAFSSANNKIAGAMRFISNGTVWMGFNLSNNTLTVNT